MILAVRLEFSVDVKILMRTPAVSRPNVHDSIEQFVILSRLLQENNFLIVIVL